MKIHARSIRTSYFRWPLLLAVLILTLFLGLHQSRLAAQEIEKVDMTGWTATMRALHADREAPQNLSPQAAVPCVGGFAGSYPCYNVDLLAFIPLSTFAASSGNDSWGWTDPLTGKEYALMGLNNGTAFVDISDPVNPLYLGKLPTHTTSSTWRDIKVYNNYAFVVSEASGHGMQVFDLTELRNVPVPPVTFSETAHFSGFGSAHNVVINEDSGYAYGVGAGTCAGGLHMVNIQNPTSPVDAGCFSADGYTHDAQCVNYTGPDPDHQGQEICFNSNEDTVTIVDVTNKANPQQISRTGYAGSAYTHQGWLTEDQHYFVFDDELDESNFGHNTRTRVLDVTDLDQPVLIGYTDSPAGAIDHNQYTHSGYSYQANYRAGLRIVDLSDVANANLFEAAYFDIYPSSDSASFNGAWNVFPYFESGVVIISGIEQGLFIVQPVLSPDFNVTAAEAQLAVCGSDSASTLLTLSERNGYAGSVTLSAAGLPAGASAGFGVNPVAVPGSSLATITTNSVAAGDYPFTFNATDGSLSHDVNMTLNVASAAPGAPTLVSPADGAANQSPQPTFTWNAAAQGVTYALEVATDPAFSNVVYSASGIAGTTHTATSALPAGSEFYWHVRATNACGDGSYSAAFRFTTAICATPNLPIPDNNPAGASSDLILSGPGSITDLNVSVTVQHSWVGDVALTLTHVDTGTSATFYDRPGVPASTFGCSGNDVNATLDDSAATPVEDECGGGTPTIDGTFIPNNPLSIFDGEALAGTWRLTAADFAGGDTGTVLEWCVLADTDAPNYAASLSDSSISAAPGDVVTHTLTLSNLGADDTYDLTLSSGSWSTTLLTTSPISLLSGETASIQLVVTIPAGASNGQSDQFTVSATSQGNPNLTVSGTGTTEAIVTVTNYPVYLPFITRP